MNSKRLTILCTSMLALSNASGAFASDPLGGKLLNRPATEVGDFGSQKTSPPLPKKMPDISAIKKILEQFKTPADSEQSSYIERVFDKRVSSSGTFSMVIDRDLWQQSKEMPTDFNQRPRGCQFSVMNTPGGYNAQRAQNLAACKHYAESIGEWTRAIDSFDDLKDAPTGLSLQPEWLLSRARLYLLVGQKEDALADIERSLTLKRTYDKSKFAAAVLLADMGNYSRAEAVSPEPNAGSPYMSPYYSYLRGLLQQQQGKKESAKQNFKDGASLFAATGATEAAQSCLDAIEKIDGPNAKTTLAISNLHPPRANSENVLRLFKALANRPDIFDLEVLKGLIGATAFKEIPTGYIVVPYRGHFKELSLVTIDKLPRGGKKLTIQMQPELCSINKSELSGLLKEAVTAPDVWRKDVIVSEGFKVPSGTLVLNTRKGPFNSIWMAQLYSKDAIFPEPPKRPIAAENADQRRLQTHHSVIMAFERGQIESAQPAVTEMLKDDPENPRAHMYQAQIYFKNGKVDEALASIDTAIKYGDKDKLLNSKYTGNTLLILKGTYLIEKGKFGEAYRTFEQAFPKQPSGEQLVLRARTEIGLKEFSKAAKDLNDASKKFYDESRIIKRDETEKLLESIRGNLSEHEQSSRD